MSRICTYSHGNYVLVLISVILLMFYFEFNYDIQLNLKPKHSRNTQQQQNAEERGIQDWHQTSNRKFYIKENYHPTAKSGVPKMTFFVKTLKKNAKIQPEIPHRKLPLENLTYRNIMQSPRPNFIKDYVSPCWKVNETPTGNTKSGSRSKVNCLPAVYLAGQPKCGSSDLFDLLTKHPDIIHTVKEPQYWSRRRFFSGSQELNKYLGVYQNATKEIQKECFKAKKGCKHRKIFIDGSVSLLWDNTNWPSLPENLHKREPQIINAHHIHHLTPNAKFIVILRNPVEREFSSYLYFTKGKKSPADFHRKVQWSIEKFTNCSNILGPRTCAYNSTLKKTLPIRLYIGLYAIYVWDWLQIFPRNQFYFLRLEDYTSYRMKYVQEILTFLGVDEAPGWFFKLDRKPIVNQRRQNTKSISDMLPKTRKVLQDFFKPYNQALVKLLNDTNYLYS